MQSHPSQYHVHLHLLIVYLHWLDPAIAHHNHGYHDAESSFETAETLRRLVSVITMGSTSQTKALTSGYLSQ